MNRIATWCMLLCIVNSACEKNDAPINHREEISGTISGTVSPAEAASGIVIAYTEGPALGTISTRYASPDDQTGQFIVEDIPTGNYSIQFLAAKGFVAPENQTVKVTAGQTKSLGSILFTENPLVSFLTFKVDDTDKAWNRYAVNTSASVSLAATYQASEVTIQGAHKTGSMYTIGGTNERLTIKLVNVTGPGTYRCNATEKSEIIYNRLSVNGKPGWTASTGIGDGSATVMITAIDPVKKTITGTFSGMLKRATYVGGFLDAEIADGTFQLPYQ